MRNSIVAVALLAIAIAFCWVDVAIGQAKGPALLVAMLGQERAASHPALFESAFTILVFLPLIVVGVIGAAVERRNAFAAGTRGATMFGVGVLIGVGGLTMSALYARFAGGITTAASPSLSLPMLAWGWGIVALQVIAEEVYFRGWLQPALAQRWGTAAAVVAGALAFAILHISGGARAPISLLNLFLGGLMFGLLAARGGGIAAVIGAHLAWNGSEQLIFGLDPNGSDGQWIGSFGSIFDWDARGSAIWGGSPDGLNGSVGMTVALLAILLPLGVLAWRRDPALGAAPAFAAA